MPKSSDLKRADVLSVNGALYVIRQIDVQSPSACVAGSLYTLRTSTRA